MKKPTTKVAPQAEVWDDPLLAEIRPAVREALEKALEEELNRTLGVRWYGRAESRVGHRNGTVVREIGTPMGPTGVEVPRARVFGPDDQVVVALYLSGTNQRRVKAALRPLLKGLPLSKSTVSRLVVRLREAREVWMTEGPAPGHPGWEPRAALGRAGSLAGSPGAAVRRASEGELA